MSEKKNKTKMKGNTKNINRKRRNKLGRNKKWEELRT
jgi:hypothetical protein